jgi:hypothetical protein
VMSSYTAMHLTVDQPPSPGVPLPFGSEATAVSVIPLLNGCGSVQGRGDWVVPGSRRDPRRCWVLLRFEPGSRSRRLLRRSRG